MEVLKFSGYVAAFSTILVAIVALFMFNSFRDKGVAVFRLYFFIAAATELIMLGFVLEDTNNMQVANTFCLLQFLLVSMALITWLPKNNIKLWLQYFLAFAMLLFTSYLIYIFSFRYFDSFSSSIEGVLLAVLSAYVLFHLTGDHSDYLYRNYKFWFAVGAFIYFSVTSLVFATGNYVLDNSLFLRNYTWVINAFLTTLANAFYIKGLLCLMKKKT